jgi:DNA-3-methyladenine glycosylase
VVELPARGAMRKNAAKNIPKHELIPRLRKSPRPLERSFFNRPPQEVAHDLLGKILVRREMGAIRAGRIVEAEAYLGSNDAAAHAAAGETARNRVLFGSPGHAYVYFTYGMHFCLNVSCMPEGEAGCVLIRSLEPVAGISKMAMARGLPLPNRRRPRELRLLAGGPARLCEAMDITRERDNGKDVSKRSSDLWIGDDGYVPAGIIRTPRIGITKSREMPLRYFIAGNEFVSGKRR